MIGQTKIIGGVLRTKDSFPRFTIIEGVVGSGRKTLAAQIAKLIGAQPVICPIAVDAVRDIIATAYKQKEPMLYILPEADKMSPAAKNALLKITEEPPRQAYFIMTVESTTNTLPTLVSRASIIQMAPYTFQDIEEYAAAAFEGADKALCTEICSVPGEVDLLRDMLKGTTVKAFADYVALVVTNLGKAPGSNVFKIGDKLSFKADDGLWDLSLFLRAVRIDCAERLKDSKEKVYADYVVVTSATLRELAIKGIHKPSTFDMWVLNMRQAWRCH